MKKRAIDAAQEYRKQFLEDIQRQNAPQPLAGLRQHPTGRYVYLSLSPGETPRQQRKAVFDYWKQYHQRHGDVPASVHDQGWLLTLPDGESFCDFLVARGVVLVTETEEEMIPLVERGAALFREFASGTGRRTGTIEDQSIFVCDDGRRIPLTECAYRILR